MTTIWSKTRRQRLCRGARWVSSTAPGSRASWVPGRTAAVRECGMPQRGEVVRGAVLSGQARPRPGAVRSGPPPGGRPRQGRTVPCPEGVGMQVRERTARHGGGPLRLAAPDISAHPFPSQDERRVPVRSPSGERSGRITRPPPRFRPRTVRRTRPDPAEPRRRSPLRPVPGTRSGPRHAHSFPYRFGETAHACPPRSGRPAVASSVELRNSATVDDGAGRLAGVCPARDGPGARVRPRPVAHRPRSGSTAFSLMVIAEGGRRNRAGGMVCRMISDGQLRPSTTEWRP